MKHFLKAKYVITKDKSIKDPELLNLINERDKIEVGTQVVLNSRKGMKMEWKEREIEYLKENWGKKKTQEIAEDLGRTYQSIYNKARKLGLGSNRAHHHRPWTEEEEEFLAENWGMFSMEHIAKKLNRTPHAIQIRAVKLGLGPFLESGDYITLNQLLLQLRGYNGRTYTVKQWIEKGLPVKTKKAKNSSFRVVNLDDFWKWAEKNRTLIDFSLLEENILGKEPEWLKEQRKADIERRMQYKTGPWTKTEEQLLIQLVNSQRYTYRELSQRLRRTEGAIKKRMSVLGIKTSLRSSIKKRWSEEETELLIDLYYKGHTPDTICNYIDRSAQACRGKIESLIKQGKLEPRSKHRKTC